MPPANSQPPHTSSTDPQDSSSYQTPHSFLSALRAIEETPPTVINLAATLNTQAEDEADANNVNFLRRTIDPQDQWRAENAAAEEEAYEESRSVRERLQRASQRAEDRERRERLQRVIARLSRIHDPAYSDRIPTQNNLYDWSPANEADDEEELQEILHELHQQQPNTHSEILRVLARSQLDSERESRTRAYSSRLSSTQPSQPSEPSATRGADPAPRSTANLLQSVRRHPRFLQRSRDYMQRYINDRDSAYRSAQDSDSRDWFGSSRGSGPSGNSSDSGRYELSRQAWQAASRSSESQAPRDRGSEPSLRMAYRRNYLDVPSESASLSSTSTWLQQTIKYLSRLRFADSYEDSLSFAVDAGFVTKEFFGDNHDDFIVNTADIPTAAETSWLTPGAQFSGSQHATSVTPTMPPSGSSSTTLYRFRNNDSMTSTTFDPARPWMGHTYASPHTRRQSESLSSSQQDRWPVKVTLHAVDYESMTLSGTMEAYNVPSHQPSAGSPPASSPAPGGASSARTSSITTYLEGEILDFARHTLLTESFKSTLINDVKYWRKLPPFSNYTDDELVRKLVSRKWMKQFTREWVLMRWKERCFVRPGRNRTSWDGWDCGDEEELAGDGCGLTISGFYYVCLRRSNGAIEGLYCDPKSSPYQHLKLLPVGGGCFPVWGFR